MESIGMKTLARSLMIVSALILFACATTKPLSINEKYDLDDQLEQVTEIYKYRLHSWQTIDRQSFILQTGPSDYYLVVLRRPSNELMFTENIAISTTGSSVRSGLDKVTVSQSGMTETYIINKIYKLKDSQQARDIEKQLTGE
jgi:hypothetical protein